MGVKKWIGGITGHGMGYWQERERWRGGGCGEWIQDGKQEDTYIYPGMAASRIREVIWDNGGLKEDPRPPGSLTLWGPLQNQDKGSDLGQRRIKRGPEATRLINLVGPSSKSG